MMGTYFRKTPEHALKKPDFQSPLKNLIKNKNLQCLKKNYLFDRSRSTKTAPKKEENKTNYKRINTSIYEIIKFYRETQKRMDIDLEKIGKNSNLIKLKQGMKICQNKDEEIIKCIDDALKFNIVGINRFNKCGKSQMNVVKKLFSARSRQPSLI